MLFTPDVYIYITTLWKSWRRNADMRRLILVCIYIAICSSVCSRLKTHELVTVKLSKKGVKVVEDLMSSAAE